MKRRSGKTERLLNTAESYLRRGIPIVIPNFDNGDFICSGGINFYDRNVADFRERLKLRMKDMKVKEFNKGYLIPLLKESWCKYLKTLPKLDWVDTPYEDIEYYVIDYLTKLNLPQIHEIHAEYVNDKIYKYLTIVDIYNYEEEEIEFLARGL